MLNNNLLAFITTLALSLIWLRLNDFAAHRGWIDSQLSRKIIHIGTGPIFVLCWFLFNDDQSSRYIAAIVPLGITLQFILVGLGVLKDEAAVQAMSRTGNPREILRGPMFYGIIFVLVTIFYWMDNPIGMISLMLMCGGDGLADILGRRWGKAKLPWSKEKSWIGTFGMFIGGWLLAIAIITIFVMTGKFNGTIRDYILPLTLISLVASAVESLPIRDIDNLSVTVTAIIMGHIFF
jgi:phytol kinase